MLATTKIKRRSRLALPRSKAEDPIASSASVQQKPTHEKREACHNSGGKFATTTTTALSRPSSNSQVPSHRANNPRQSVDTDWRVFTTEGSVNIDASSSRCAAVELTLTDIGEVGKLPSEKGNPAVFPAADADDPAIAASEGQGQGGDYGRMSVGRARAPLQSVQLNARPEAATTSWSKQQQQQQQRHITAEVSLCADGEQQNTSSSDSGGLDIEQDAPTSSSKDSTGAPPSSEPLQNQHVRDNTSSNIEAGDGDAQEQKQQRPSRKRLRPARPTPSSSTPPKRSPPPPAPLPPSPPPQPKLNHRTVHQPPDVNSSVSSEDVAVGVGAEDLPLLPGEGESAEGGAVVLVLGLSSCESTGVGVTVTGKESTSSTIHSSGERCPVCGSALWGLGVHARQVHINSCLDQMASRRGGCEGIGEVNDHASGGVGAGSAGMASGSRPSTGVAKKPKTEFQEHIQMAKALSKSLVVATAAAANGLEEEEGSEMDPAAYRAKEKRLVGTLRDLDAKLERLHKDRDATLKRLAAHRALGSSISGAAATPGHEGFGAPKTAAEVIGALFPDAQGASIGHESSSPKGGRDSGRTTRGDDRVKESSVAGLSSEIDRSVKSASEDEGTDCSYKQTAGGEVRGSEEVDGSPRTCGRGRDEHDGTDGGAATLTRRRSSCGRYGGRKGGASSGGRTFWGIAQEADELSQSNFVTGVFADIKAKAAPRRRDTRESRTSTASVAAAYGDASMYRRRSPRSSAGVAAPASTPGADDDRCVVVMLPSPKLGRGRGSSTAAVEAGCDESRLGNEMDGKDGNVPSVSSSPASSSHVAEENGALKDADNAAGDAVLLLSQTLSGQHPTATSDAEVTAVRAASTEEERVTACHIARAPVEAVASVFPDWEENVRFVFRQSAPELRHALLSIGTALSEEGAAGAILQDGACTGGGVLEIPARRTAKAEALMFFEGVILEALELRASEESAARSPVTNDDEGSGIDVRDKSIGGRGGSSGCRGLGRGKGNRDGEEGVVHGVLDDRGSLPHVRVEGEKWASGAIDGDTDACGNGDGGGGWTSRENQPSAARAVGEQGEEELLDAMSDGGSEDDDARASGEREGNGKDADMDGGSRDEDESGYSSTGGARAAAAAGAESDGTIVLSGDSCRDAIVTFDLTSSELGKDSTATACAALPGAEPPDSQDGSRGAGRDLTDTVEVADGAAVVNSENCGDDLQGHDDTDDGLEDGPSTLPSPVALDETDAPRTLPSSPPLSPVPSPDSQRSPPAAQPKGAPPAQEEDDDCEFDLPDFCRRAPQPPVLAAAAAVGASDELCMLRRGEVSLEGSSLTRRVLARPSRDSGDAAVTAAPVLGRSQPVGVNPAPRGAVSLERGGVEEGAASSAGGGGGSTPEVMPSFNQMTLQELAGIMSVYGLKKKSKREMVDRLEQIWKALHPSATAPEAEETGCETGVSGAGDGDTFPGPALPPGARGGSSLSQGRRTEELTRSATTLTTGHHRPLRARQPPPSSRTKRGLEGVSSDKEALGARIRAVITGNVQLHEDILLLKTVELSATQQLLKDAGVKCSKRDLGLYLDEKGITFVDRSGRTRDSPSKKRRRAADGSGRASSSQT